MAAENALRQSLESAVTARIAFENHNFAASAAAYASGSESCLKAFIELQSGRASGLIFTDRCEEAHSVAEFTLKVAPRDSYAWYWKGMALSRLNRFEEGKQAFDTAAKYETDPGRKDMMMGLARDGCKKSNEEILAIKNEGDTTSGADNGTSARTAPANHNEQEAVKPINKARVEWYQSTSHVNIDIYAKKVIKDESIVSFQENAVDIKLRLPEAEDYIYKKQLFSGIVPSESSWNVNRFKVEIRLKKIRLGEKWKALDTQAEILSVQAQAGQESIKRRSDQKARDDGLKSYADNELEDYKEDDSAMSLFRTIYKDADENVRRAMMKSYSESGGKVLSTNWDEVKKEKVTYKERND